MCSVRKLWGWNRICGDIIEVTLEIRSAINALQVALSDPISFGSNILSEDYGSYSSGEKSYRGYKLYFEYLPQGKTIVKYQYQQNNPGTFELPSTRAKRLYIQSIFGSDHLFFLDNLELRKFLTLKVEVRFLLSLQLEFSQNHIGC